MTNQVHFPPPKRATHDFIPFNVNRQKISRTGRRELEATTNRDGGESDRKAAVGYTKSKVTEQTQIQENPVTLHNQEK